MSEATAGLRRLKARPAIGLKNGHDGHKQKVLCANGFYSP